LVFVFGYILLFDCYAGSNYNRRIAGKLAERLGRKVSGLRLFKSYGSGTTA